tara:strand:- start:1238 stop:1552 length:315 start_codon:yes stop_codon:yes gene_type:complete
MIETEEMIIDRPVSAIIRFGFPMSTDGFRPGEYLQCTIDPNMVSPGGEFIRFDQIYQKGELHGWQRIAGITVCEILGDAPPMEEKPEGYIRIPDSTVIMRLLSG